MKLGLSPEQLLLRRQGIGGSDAGKIMAGEWYDLWLDKTGRKEPEDLSRVLPVQLGNATEEFNAYWYALMTGHTVGRRGESAVHAQHNHMRCTLDGIVEAPPARMVWQAKHVSGREPIETIVQRYTPQVTHEMLVCGLDRAVLSVLLGTDRFEAIEIALDEFYACTLIDREREFWGFVERNMPPLDAPPVAAPVNIKELRKVDMNGNNRWSMLAGDWLLNRQAAALHDAAAKGLKALIEPDVGEAKGHGVTVKRDKRGLSIKEI